MDYSIYHKPTTIFLYMFIGIFLSMLFCVLLTTLQPKTYATDFHTFTQPDGTPVELKIYGDNLCIKAETPEGILVVRDTYTGWICYAIPNSAINSYSSSGVPYIPGNMAKHRDGKPLSLHNATTSITLPSGEPGNREIDKKNQEI
ncbi:MAG: hypothetical protein JXJ04_02420 [Spirochaetales bacterium]|nr:hypothetical protein [Spirochaetales bacterium]